MFIDFLHTFKKKQNNDNIDMKKKKYLENRDTVDALPKVPEPECCILTTGNDKPVCRMASSPCKLHVMTNQAM